MSISIIAKKAGVSTSTVSRVLNGSDRISNETKDRVLKVVHALNYKRRLYRGVTRDIGAATGTIGLLWVDIDPKVTQHVFFVSLFGELSRALAAQGLRMVLIDVRSDQVPRDLLEKAGVDGLFVIGPHILPEALILQIRMLPVVLLFAGAEGALAWADLVRPDDAMVGRMAAEYFLSRGIRDAVFLCSRPSHVEFAERGESFVRAMHEAGAKGGAYIGKNSANYYYWSMAKLSAETDIVLKRMTSELKALPRGIFVPSDDDAVVLQNLLQHQGIKVGTQVELVCCNNDDTLLGLLLPRPVSIDINKPALAQEATSRLVKRLNGGNGSRGVKILIPPLLVLPSSTEDHHKMA